MLKLKLHFITNGVFVGGVFVSLYALMNTYLDRRNLPPGACPIDDNRGTMYLGIGLLVLYFLMDFYEKKVRK